jgi:hypothetical protein
VQEKDAAQAQLTGSGLQKEVESLKEKCETLLVRNKEYLEASKGLGRETVTNPSGKKTFENVAQWSARAVKDWEQGRSAQQVCV